MTYTCIECHTLRHRQIDCADDLHKPCYDCGARNVVHICDWEVWQAAYDLGGHEATSALKDAALAARK